MLNVNSWYSRYSRYSRNTYLCYYGQVESWPCENQWGHSDKQLQANVSQSKVKGLAIPPLLPSTTYSTFAQTKPIHELGPYFDLTAHLWKTWIYRLSLLSEPLTKALTYSWNFSPGVVWWLPTAPHAQNKFIYIVLSMIVWDNKEFPFFFTFFFLI